MKTKFGTVLVPDRPGDIPHLVSLVERSGFDQIRVADSQSLYPEMYVCLTLAAMHTSHIKLGAGVTNPITRHPAVTASALASVHDLAYGRLFVVIGTGDSALLNLGYGAASLQSLEEYVTTLRELHTNGESVYQGRIARLSWFRGHIPIYVAAHGPRSLRLAGRIADGVIIGLGVTKESVSLALRCLQEGAAEAGRSLDELDIWWAVFTNISRTTREAVGEIRAALAVGGHLLARGSLDGKAVPDQWKEPLTQLMLRYNPLEHGSPGNSANALLVDDLGLVEYLNDRFGLAGTPEDCVEKVQQLAELGVRKLFLSVAMRQKERFFSEWARAVVPRL